MDWNDLLDVLDVLDEAPLAVLEQCNLTELHATDPSLFEGLRALERADLALHGDKRELAEALLSGGDVAARLTTKELFSLMERSATDEASFDEASDGSDLDDDEALREPRAPRD